MYERKLLLRAVILTAALLFSSYDGLFAQTKGKIKGQIKDDKGELLTGATVFIEGSTKGSAADADGYYLLDGVAPGDYTLKASFLGYKTGSATVTVFGGETSEINFTLETDYLELDGVVVTGYKTTEKRFVVGSVASIKAEQLSAQPLGSIEQFVQGRAPGVQITAANGIPGSPVRVVIRGISSISAGSEPLYVVDGIPITTGDFSPGNLGSRTNALSDINPNEIETMDILKDAAATAIYGSRGANGVILITTKRGKAGKPRFSASYYAGLVTMSRRLNFLDATTHLALRNQARRIQGLPDERPTAQLGAEGWTRSDADAYAAVGGSDWVDATTRLGNTQEFNLSASGGNENNVYYFNTTYRRDNSFLVGNSFERISGRFNMDSYITRRLTVGLNFNVNYVTNNRVPIGTAGGFGRAQELLPYLPIISPNGTYFNPDDNPVWKLENSDFRAGILRNLMGVTVDYKITPGLTFRSQAGMDVLNQIEKEINKRNTKNPASVTSIWDRRTTVYNWTTTNTLRYDFKIGPLHKFSVIGGNELQRSYTRGIGLEGFNFVNDALTNPGAAANANRNSYGYEDGFSFVSNFVKADYRLMERYLFGASLRSDASSRFGPDRRTGLFYALSAGWLLSSEDFIRSIPKLSYLKLSGSLGKTGNANIGNYEWIGRFDANTNYNGQNGIAPVTRLPNRNISWEDNLGVDFTLDYGFFNDRISGSMSFYYRRSYNMLLDVRVPTSTGFELYRDNVASLFNRGFEFQVQTKNLLNTTLKWNTEFNIATNRNRVTDVAGSNPDAFDQFPRIGQGGEGRVVLNHPVGVAFVVPYAGVQQLDGTIPLWNADGSPRLDGNGVQRTGNVRGGEQLFYDRNGNLMTNSTAPTGNIFDERRPTGSPVPKFFGGINNIFKYKNFDFNLFFVFSYGNKVYDDAAKNQIGLYGNFAQREEVLNHWTPERPVTDVPNIVNYQPINSSRFLYDASYIRLRNMTIGYTLSPESLKRMRLSNLRVYFTGTNIFLITPYKGLDPEVLQNTQTNTESGNIAASGPYLGTPQARTFILGFTVNF
jgi:TonB-dependent starch-binding outer membrane protein SusC